MNVIVFIYLLLMSAVAFFLFGIDKKRAIKQRRRISETQLLVFSFVGGTIGAIAGMYAFRHKLAKPAFMRKFYGVVFVQVLLVGFLIFEIYLA